MAQRQVMPEGHVIEEAVPFCRAGSNALSTANRQFLNAAKVFWDRGIRANQISGKERVLQVVADVRATVIAGMSKTAQHLIMIQGHSVANLIDSDKGLREIALQRVGANIGCIVRHLRKMEEPKPRGPRQASDAGSTGGPDFKNDKSAMHGWSRQLNALKAGALIVRNDKDQTMTAEDAVELQKALTIALAVIGKYTG